MKWVIVIGCSGGGKSVFSRALAKKTGLPLYHLDNLYWNSDGTKAEPSEFLERLRRAMVGDAWILDGNFRSTMELRLMPCDTVFFLDYPTEVCLEGAVVRLGKPRPDIPWVEQEPDGDFLDFIRRFPTEHRPGILELLERYPEKTVITFHSREEAAACLQTP